MTEATFPIVDAPERLAALVDLLCAAAAADKYIAPVEVIAVEAMLRKLLGTDALPEDVAACTGRFDRNAFDLHATLGRLAPETEEQAQAVLSAAVEVVAADRFIDSSEYGFIGELADMLGLPVPF